MSASPSPSKSPVPTICQVVGATPSCGCRTYVAAVHLPGQHRAVVVAPHDVAVAVAVEIPGCPKLKIVRLCADDSGPGGNLAIDDVLPEDTGQAARRRHSRLRQDVDLDRAGVAQAARIGDLELELVGTGEVVSGRIGERAVGVHHHRPVDRPAIGADQGEGERGVGMVGIVRLGLPHKGRVLRQCARPGRIPGNGGCCYSARTARPRSCARICLDQCRRQCGLARTERLGSNRGQPVSTTCA